MSPWFEETFCLLNFSQLQGFWVLCRNHTIIGFSDSFPKEMNLYVFLQSIYQSLGFSLNFETTSQFQPNLEHFRHLKDITFLRLCRNWELNRIERFKLELSETEAKVSDTTGSAWQQLGVPGSHRPNLYICSSHSPARPPQPAWKWEGRRSSWTREDLGHQSHYAGGVGCAVLIQLCLFCL